MAHALKRLTIRGFKSIRSLVDFELTNMNVFIGANGVGKTNFIEFFRMIRAMMELTLPGIGSSSLRTYIAHGGGSDDFLFHGPKVTSQIEAEMGFGDNVYHFRLVPNFDETFLLYDESMFSGNAGWKNLGSGNQTPKLLSERKKDNVASEIYESISSWKIYHFHDTSSLGPMRRSETRDDCEYLRFDGANIAPFLLYIRESDSKTYEKIIETIQLVAPFFEDFILKPDANEKIRLRWRQKGSDYPLKPHHLSDGTLRFICMVTALLQPYPMSAFLIDEPELGLHPYAIEILAELMQSVSQTTQLIISTQSPALVDCFQPEDIIVANREDGESIFHRLNRGELSSWLEEYSLGELWRKNIVTGVPVYE